MYGLRTGRVQRWIQSEQKVMFCPPVDNGEEEEPYFNKCTPVVTVARQHYVTHQVQCLLPVCVWIHIHRQNWPKYLLKWRHKSVHYSISCFYGW